jgi:hypothetical protein
MSAAKSYTPIDVSNGGSETRERGHRRRPMERQTCNQRGNGNSVGRNEIARSRRIEGEERKRKWRRKANTATHSNYYLLRGLFL